MRMCSPKPNNACRQHRGTTLYRLASRLSSVLLALSTAAALPSGHRARACSHLAEHLSHWLLNLGAFPLHQLRISSITISRHSQVRESSRSCDGTDKTTHSRINTQQQMFLASKLIGASSSYTSSFLGPPLSHLACLCPLIQLCKTARGNASSGKNSPRLCKGPPLAGDALSFNLQQTNGVRHKHATQSRTCVPTTTAAGVS
jgi:hypothetical protein